MTKSTLDKAFKHSIWFKGEKITVREALDELAKDECFYLDRKPARKQPSEISMFSPVKYDEVIRYASMKEKSYYKVNEEEKEYFLERVEFYQQEKERQYAEWLNCKVDLNKELNKCLAGNYFYNTGKAEREINRATERNDNEGLKYWEKELEFIKVSKLEIYNAIMDNKDSVKTNKDFLKLKEIIDSITEKYDKVYELMEVI